MRKWSCLTAAGGAWARHAQPAKTPLLATERPGAEVCASDCCPPALRSSLFTRCRERERVEHARSRVVATAQLCTQLHEGRMQPGNRHTRREGVGPHQLVGGV